MKDRLEECIKQRKTSYTPIWFMRQAGRYLPEFREIRKKNPNFIKLCLNSELVNEITLQPLKKFYQVFLRLNLTLDKPGKSCS